MATSTDKSTATTNDYGASHTSCYTDEKALDKYETLDDILNDKYGQNDNNKLRQVILDLFAVCAEITDALRSTLVHVQGDTNNFGDTLLSVDVIADELLWKAAKASKVIREGSSEEDPVVRNVVADGDNDNEAEYTVCWDPLDGSSIVDNNWAVGTMVGVWPKSTGLIGATGRDQVTSLVAQYGPRTTVLVALSDGVYEFTYKCKPPETTEIGALQSDGTATTTWPDWICTRQRFRIAPTSKIFSPANIRAAQELPGYRSLVDAYLNDRYTLRYTGGLVPDVYQQFTKRQGIFTNPTAPGSPAKLRIAFEAAPFGLLVEAAGGKTSDGISGNSILDVSITAVDQRTPVAFGSANEVDKFNKFVLNL